MSEQSDITFGFRVELENNKLRLCAREKSTTDLSL